MKKIGILLVAFLLVAGISYAQERGGGDRPSKSMPQGGPRGDRPQMNPEEMIKRAGTLLKRNLEIYDSAATEGISQIKMRFDPEQKEESNPLH